ncbi:LAO/AO transport system kinase [Natronincola peptidivorans]|uniref:LAO/AO transport system kinase n=1 Tax=Natronincola peptidivorans TaxID=426128 RepID=A0A1I0AHA9_9FIRM|nr:methylmalonyl Co-A mutase-associated GTPase MeaB [Natronincola peptidivorans]SES93657.1 LAO/AO transport system kinase [Natronincola peptidivorans]
MDLAERLLKGDKRAAARLITMVENNDKDAIDVLSTIYKHTGKAKVVGITGPPGAGKSTLTDKLVKRLRQENKTVGIIAVDPTSPFTGGSILGDRIRMSDLNTDPGVFIRSMGTRGHLGGLSKATLGAVKILDAYGLDYILIETVGVGQSEVDIVKAADTVVMVMVPGLGDDIQAIKAGIMEIGDVFIINKADREGADRTKTEIQMMLDFNHGDWRPPVTKVVAIKNEGIEELVENLQEHENYLERTGKGIERRISNSEMEILHLTQQSLMSKVLDNNKNKNEIRSFAEKVAKRETDPYTISNKIIEQIIMENKDSVK